MRSPVAPSPPSSVIPSAECTERFEEERRRRRNPTRLVGFGFGWCEDATRARRGRGGDARRRSPRLVQSTTIDGCKATPFAAHLPSLHPRQVLLLFSHLCHLGTPGPRYLATLYCPNTSIKGLFVQPPSFGTALVQDPRGDSPCLSLLVLLALATALFLAKCACCVSQDVQAGWTFVTSQWWV